MEWAALRPMLLCMQGGAGMEELSQSQAAVESDRPQADAIWNIKVSFCCPSDPSSLSSSMQVLH